MVGRGPSLFAFMLSIGVPSPRVQICVVLELPGIFDLEVLLGVDGWPSGRLGRRRGILLSGRRVRLPLGEVGAPSANASGQQERCDPEEGAQGDGDDEDDQEEPQLLRLVSTKCAKGNPGEAAGDDGGGEGPSEKVHEGPVARLGSQAYLLI